MEEETVDNVKDVQEIDELELTRKQLEAAIMTAQHYALVATRAVHLLGGELFFGAEEVEELRDLVMIQRLNDDDKLEYRVVTNEEAAEMQKERRLEEEKKLEQLKSREAEVDDAVETEED